MNSDTEMHFDDETIMQGRAQKSYVPAQNHPNQQQPTILEKRLRNDISTFVQTKGSNPLNATSFYSPTLSN